MRARTAARTDLWWSRVLILAFDTATGVATSALVDDGETLGERTTRSPRACSRTSMSVLREGGAQAASLGGIVVGTGPGSFTSLRMGLSAARALAFALEVPVGGSVDARCPGGGSSGRPAGDRRPAARGLHARRRRARSDRARRTRRRRVTRSGSGRRRGCALSRACSRRPARTCRRTTSELHVPRAQPSCRPGRRLRPGGAGRADLRARARRGQGARHDASSVRKLKLRDLDAIEEIERSSYPTPWSRSMFAGELAKPSSICLGAIDPDDDAARRRT